MMLNSLKVKIVEKSTTIAEHALEERQGDVPEARDRPRAVGLRRLVELLRDRDQPRQERDREEGQAAPDVDDDDGGHRVVLLAEPVGPGRVDDAAGQEGPVDDAVERVEHPRPAQGRQRGRDDPGEQHGAADQALEPELLVEQQGERDSQDDLGADRGAAEDERVLERLPKRVALPEPDEVADPNEVAGSPDEGVRDREVECHEEGVGDEEQEQDEGGAHEDRAQPTLAVEELAQPRSQRQTGGCGDDANVPDSHVSSPCDDLLHLAFGPHHGVLRRRPGYRLGEHDGHDERVGDELHLVARRGRPPVAWYCDPFRP